MTTNQAPETNRPNRPNEPIQPSEPIQRTLGAQEIEDHDRGLLFDLSTLRVLNRRAALGVLGAAGVAAGLAACGSSSAGTGDPAAAAGATTATGSSASTTSTSAAATSTAASTSGAADESAALTEINSETAGPYPGDGSNGPDALSESGVVRADIRSSFGSSSTTAPGIPLTIELTVKDAGTGAAMAGAAVYAWHCDRDGNYSMYSAGVTGENYLRGVQAADSAGTVRFTSIFPACYSGRWPHIHFEVYRSVDEATSDGQIVKTSQMALPQDACSAVYATTGYSRSVTNLAQVSLARDNVFGDDSAAHQLATMSGSVDAGYTAALVVGV